MKSIIKNKYVLLLSLVAIVLIGFSACEKEKTVEALTVEEYKAEFSGVVNSEITLVEGTTRGYNVGEIYAVDTVFDKLKGDYLDSLYVAKEIIATPNVTFEELFDANFAITEVGSLFHDEVFIADKRALNDLVTECDTFRVYNSDTGTSVGQYSGSAYLVFIDAIDEAKRVRDDGAGNEGWVFKRVQRQVDAEIDSLNKDYSAYKVAKIQ